MPFLSVIIPAYNEEDIITGTLKDISSYLSGENFSYEIIVMNDGSKDKTSQIVNGLVGEIPHLSIIDNEFNRGKGAVVRQGMLESSGEIRLFTDADNSTSIEHIKLFLPFMTSNANPKYDVVIASRAVQGSRLDPPQPVFRRIAGKVLNIFAQILLLPGIWDTQCGFKVFTATAAEAIFSRTKINGWTFDIEVLAIAKKLGFKIKEAPVHWKNNPFSHVPFSAGLRFIYETVTIRFKLWMGGYA